MLDRLRSIARIGVQYCAHHTGTHKADILRHVLTCNCRFDGIPAYTSDVATNLQTQKHRLLGLI